MLSQIEIEENPVKKRQYVIHFKYLNYIMISMKHS